MHFGNPNLKAEKSTTYELGWRIDNKKFLLDAAIYQIKAKDFIDRKSITSAEVSDLGYGTAGTRNWLWVNASMQKREITFANGYETKDSGLPSYMARAGVQWDVLPNLNLDAYARSQGNALRRDDTGAVETLGESHRFITWNLAALYQPTETVEQAEPTEPILCDLA